MTNSRASRRRFLAGGAALATASFSPNLLSAQTSARIVVIGGGWGGISVARNLKETLPSAEVTMVEPKSMFMSCPMSVHYIVGSRSSASLTFDYSALTNIGVRHVKEIAQSIDRDAKIVVTETERLPYDFLVLSPGIDYMEDAIPGFSDHRDKLPVGFRAFEQEAVKNALESYDGGNIVLSVPQMPFRCPIAPYERAAMFAEWMDKHDKPGKLILLDQNPGVPIGAPAITSAYAELYGDRIEHVNGVEFQSVNAETKTIETNTGKLTYGMAALVPPQQAAGIIRTAGLGERWAKVAMPNFQSAMDDSIYVIGDSVGAPLPKSGHLAYEAGVRVAGLISDRISDVQAEINPIMPSAICFAAFNRQEAMGVNVSVEWDDFEEKPVAKPSVDNARSADAMEIAEAWSTSVWAQLLG
ncbi:MAG: FAD/NAD(P)-binding oxidoreductase [Pseudomonadota bacterium]